MIHSKTRSLVFLLVIGILLVASQPAHANFNSNSGELQRLYVASNSAIYVQLSNRPSSAPSQASRQVP